MYWQTTLTLAPKPRGFHLITREVTGALQEAPDVRQGLLHLHLCHTSASLTVNENADPAVQDDLETFINRLVPDIHPGEGYTHTYEGPDDLPAHFKASLLGCQLTLPVTDGRLNLGTWQGIMLGEHRDQTGPRRLVLTLQGE